MRKPAAAFNPAFAHHECALVKKRWTAEHPVLRNAVSGFRSLKGKLRLENLISEQVGVSAATWPYEHSSLWSHEIGCDPAARRLIRMMGSFNVNLVEHVMSVS